MTVVFDSRVRERVKVDRKLTKRGVKEYSRVEQSLVIPHPLVFVKGERVHVEVKKLKELNTNEV